MIDQQQPAIRKSSRKQKKSQQKQHVIKQLNTSNTNNQVKKTITMKQITKQNPKNQQQTLLTHTLNQNPIQSQQKSSKQSNKSNPYRVKSHSVKQTSTIPFYHNQFTLSNTNNHHHQQILNQYFKSFSDFKTNTISKLTAVKYSQLIHSNLQQKIDSGQLKISKKTHQIKHLLNQSSKLSSEELKLLQIKTQAQIKTKKIQLLDPFQQHKIQKLKTKQFPSQDQTQNLQLLSIISNSVLSKQQHHKLIEKFRLSNKKNQQQRKQRLFQSEERQRSLSYEKQQAEQSKRKKQKQLRRLSIEQKLTQRKQMHEKFLQQQRNSTQKYKQVKKKTFLHQNLQEKYKSEVLIPILEQKKMKLKQLRDFYKKYDISEIKKHQLQYLQKLSKSTQKNTSRTKINSFNYNPPQKSKKLSQLLQEENQRAKIKFQEKKRILQENKLKQLDFLSEIKLKFKPKIDSNKKQEIQQRLKTSKAQVKHKYSQRDLKQLGMRYFQEAKSKMKKNHDKQKTQGNDIQQKSVDKNPKFSRKNKQKTQGNDKNLRQDQQNEFLHVPEMRKINTQRDEKKINISTSVNPNHRIKINESKRKQIRKIINSQNLDRQQKLQRLKLQNERINQIYKRRQRFYLQNEDDENTRQQAIGLLLNSIQTKMGIIDICALK